MSKPGGPGQVGLQLLEPSRIDVELTAEFQLDPEQSTSAIVVHHPEAKTFRLTKRARCELEFPTTSAFLFPEH